MRARWRRADDDGPVDASLDQERQRSGGVLGGIPRVRLDHQLDVRPLPRGSHLLALGALAVSRAAGEDDGNGIGLSRERLGLRDEPQATAAHAVDAVTTGRAVARHDDRNVRSHSRDGSR